MAKLGSYRYPWKSSEALNNSDVQRQSHVALERCKSLPTIARSIERMTIDIRNTRKMCYRRRSLARWDRATCGTKFGAIILSLTEQNLLTADWRSICTSTALLQILQQHRPVEPFCWATNIISRQCNRGVDLGFQCFSQEGEVVARENG